MTLNHNYSKDGTPLAPAELSPKIMENIGRIFRASAEIEDVVSFYLCRIGQISEGHAILLLGRSPMSKKIEIARNFAKAHGDKELERFRKTIDDDHLKAAIEFRNTLPHGALLGLTDDGRFAFRTLKTLDQSKEGVTLETNSYTAEEFEHCASSLESAVPWLETELRVADVRKARSERGLSAHTKA